MSGSGNQRFEAIPPGADILIRLNPNDSTHGGYLDPAALLSGTYAPAPTPAPAPAPVSQPAGPAASGSEVLVYLSAHGITSDATNGVDFGVAAPAGATGQEAAINALLASAVALATAIGGGVRVVWDAAVALGAPVYLYSNMVIEAPSPSFGAIIRPGAQCPVFRLKGMDADQTIAANSQKSFGKYDPAHNGDTRYRVFDPAFVNARNVAVIGGTWNANSPQQPPVGGDGSNAYTAAYGFLDVFQFWGVDGLLIRDVRLFLSSAFVVHILNARHVLIEDVDLDQRYVAPGYFTDGLHFNGPAEDITIRRVRTHTFDDHIAVSPNDAQFNYLNPGVNWIAGGGPITGVLVEDWEIWNGRDGTMPQGSMRMLSTVHKLDLLTVRNVRGLTSAWSFLAEPWATSILNGAGVFGRMLFDDISLDVVPTGSSSGWATWQFTGAVDSVCIRNRFRSNAQGFPDIRVEQGAVMRSLSVEGDWFQPAGAPNNEPVVRVAGTVDLLQVRGRIYRDSGVAAGAAPAVSVGTDPAYGQRQQGTGAVALIDVDVAAEGITNLVDVQAGTVGAVVLRGSHRKAAGGSPLNVASGAAVTNYLSGGLVYDHNNVTASSGGGNITRLDYSESAAVSYASAYTTALNRSTGAANNAVTMTFTPTGGAWPTGTVLTPSATGVAGSFAPASLNPTGAGAVTCAFTPSDTGNALLTSATNPALANTSGAQPYSVTASPAAGGPVLDAITAQPAAALGLRRMRAAYAGSAIQVRRSSDNTTASIGFNGSGGLDTAALLAFVGSGSGTVATWFDQSGNGHDFANSSAAAEPIIAQAGAVLMAGGVPTTNFNGQVGNYCSNGVSGIGSAATFVTVAKQAGTGDTTLVSFVQYGANSYGNATGAQGFNATAGSLYAYRANAKAEIDTTAVQSLFQASTTYDGANESIALNGGTPVSVASTGNFQSGGNLFLGAANNGSGGVNNWTGFASEVIFYPAALSAADLATLHANQSAYFGTP